jgi:perosamine synthetase
MYPKMKFLGYGRQNIDEKDIEAVISVLKGNFLTQGPAVRAFEEALASYVGARFAVVVSNGTAALHLACLAADMAPGDIGVTQAITFVASINCMTYCGARPDLVDIDPDTLNMSEEALREYLDRNPECKIIIPVAMGGLSHNGQRIRELVGNRIIIEDACHALGGTTESKARVGGGGYADMTVFSFHPVKPITTGEGGAIVTDREDLYHKLLALRNHGIIREPETLSDTSQADNPWYYEQQLLGFNYRLCDILAALGKEQLSRIDKFIERRREIASYYDRHLPGINGLRLVQSNPDYRARSGHHLYIVKIDFQSIGKARANIMRKLAEKQIGTQVHYIPVHHHPYYRARLAEESPGFPEAESYYRECLTLPCHPGLSNEELSWIVASLRDALSSD